MNSQPTGLNSLRFKLGTLSILYVTVFLTRIGFGTILIIFPDRRYLQFSSSGVVGLIIASYPLVEGVAALPVGAYIDRRGRRRAFVLGMSLISILTLILGLTNNVLIVGVTHAMMGLSAALVTISSLTMITDLTGVHNRGAGMGGFDFANLGGYGIGILLGLFFSTIFDRLGNTFIVVAAIFAAATVFIYFFLREPPHTSEKRKSLREMYESLTGEVSAIFPLWFSMTIITGMYFFLPRLASRASTVPRQVVSSSSAPTIILGLLIVGAGALFFGRLSDKIGRTRTIMIGVAGEIGFLLIFPDLFQKLVLIPPGQSFLVTIQEVGVLGVVGGIMFFLGSALVPTILAFVGDKAAHDYRGSAMGLYSLMLSAGLALGTVLAGVADDLGSQGGLNPQAGIQAVFYTGVIIFSTLSLTSGLLFRRSRLPPMGAGLPKGETKPL